MNGSSTILMVVIWIMAFVFILCIIGYGIVWSVRLVNDLRAYINKENNPPMVIFSQGSPKEWTMTFDGKKPTRNGVKVNFRNNIINGVDILVFKDGNLTEVNLDGYKIEKLNPADK
jgi:hypothetical protein